MVRFFGSLDELKQLISEIDHFGRWEHDPNLLAEKHAYRASTGAVMNWWPKNGTLSIQGPRDAALEFETKFMHVMNEARIRGTLDGTATNRSSNPF
jgi:hypothetical protein